MKRNPSYITKLLEASSTVETYRVREELREKLLQGFSPEEARDFIYELLELVYDYKALRRDSEILKEFAELIARYIPASYIEKTL